MTGPAEALPGRRHEPSSPAVSRSTDAPRARPKTCY